MTTDLPARALLGTDRQVIFECPSGFTATIQNIRVVNTDLSNTITINIYAEFDGMSVLITQRDLILPPGAKGLDDDEMLLQPGDRIQGDASANGLAHVTIFGRKEASK